MIIVAHARSEFLFLLVYDDHDVVKGLVPKMLVHLKIVRVETGDNDWD